MDAMLFIMLKYVLCTYNPTLKLVKGRQQTQYLSRLRDTLNTIFDDYKSSRPELKYEVLLPNGEENQILVFSLLNDNINKLLQPEDQIIGNALAGQKIVTGYSNFPYIDPGPTMKGYGIYNDNRKYYIFGDLVNGPKKVSSKDDNRSNYIDNSKTINISFRDFSDNLQGIINSLARELDSSDDPQDFILSKKLKETAIDLEEAIQEIPADIEPYSADMEKVRRTLQKKGLRERIETLGEDLIDEKSDLRKKIGSGVKTLQKIGKAYNSVGQWFGLPHVPDFFLGKDDKNK